MQRTLRSFKKNGKERKTVVFFWKEQMPNPAYQFGSDSIYFSSYNNQFGSPSKRFGRYIRYSYVHHIDLLLLFWLLVKVTCIIWATLYGVNLYSYAFALGWTNSVLYSSIWSDHILVLFYSIGWTGLLAPCLIIFLCCCSRLDWPTSLLSDHIFLLF